MLSFISHYIVVITKGLKRRLFVGNLKKMYRKRITINEDYFFDSDIRFNLDKSNSSVYISKGVFLRDYCRVLAHYDGKIVIGERVFFNYGCSINSYNLVTIGDDTIFGENVKIYDHNHRFTDKSVPIHKQGYKSAPVSIGKNCWIASNVTILKGVTIGDNVIIGAHNLIYQSIPSGTVVKATTSYQVTEY